MKCYADTSWWMAFKCEADPLHGHATRLFDRHEEAYVVWTPWQRVEVFNTYRQMERQGLVLKGESARGIRLLEKEIRLGYWPHQEFDWEDAVRQACELSAAAGLRQTVRGMDLFHIAVALEIGADVFMTFDQDQADLARVAGLELVKL
jgi:predicted nucleic acid-binding protein